MSVQALSDLARPHQLEIFGVLNLTPEDGFGPGVLALLGPREPGFWAHVTSTPEFNDGQPDPLDRWSRRTIDSIAEQIGGTSAFPFGEPLRPFMTWALRSGRAWSSPVGILVHDTAGLMVSYRGAVILPNITVDAPEAARPCETCVGQPCLIACPPRALTGDGYDLPRCHAFLDTEDGAACMTKGCAVRRSCPQGASYGRLEAQSSYHMGLFHR